MIHLTNEDKFNELLDKFANAKTRIARSTDKNEITIMDLYKEGVRAELIAMANLPLDDGAQEQQETDKCQS